MTSPFLTYIAILFSWMHAQYAWSQESMSTTETLGISESLLQSIHEDIQNGDYGLVDHFLIIRNGKVIADHHYKQDYKTIAKDYDPTLHQYNYDHPDWHPYYNYTDLHSLQSVTKTVTSLLMGIAYDEGLLMDLDEPVYPLFSAYNIDLSDERKRSITLRNLLTMQSGISWDENSVYADDAENNCIVMELSDNWIQYVLDRPMATNPGGRFVYNSGVSVLLGKIVQMATGQRIDKWAEEKLFGPLGIDDYYWKITPKGEVDTEGGLYLNPYDLAKIAQLTLNRGKWEGQQIVSEEWVDDSTKPWVNLDSRYSYGYQWWIGHHGDHGNSYNMRGYGGQIVNIVPKYDLILVFNGWNIHANSKRRTDRILDNRILPMFE